MSAPMTEYAALPKIGTQPERVTAEPVDNTPPFDIDRPAANLPSVVMAGPDDEPATETAGELVDRAEISNGTSLVKLSKSEKLVADLLAAHKAMKYSMATTKEAAATRAFRARCVELRTSVAKHCLMLRKPAITFGKEVIAAEKALVAQIEAVEAVSDAVIKADEKRRADEKAAQEKAEAERKQAIDEAIGEITSRVVACIGQSAAFIGETIQWLDNTEITEEDFGDRKAEASTALAETRARLVTMQATAEAAESAAADAKIAADRLKQQQEELDKKRADLERREAIDGRIEAIRALPDTLVVATVDELTGAIAGLQALNPDDFGTRFHEARMAAAAVLPELQALLDTAIEEATQQSEAACEQAAAEEEEPVHLGDAPEVAPPAPAPAAPPPVAIGSTARPAAAPRREFRPTDSQLIEVLCLHFRVHESKVIEWLLSLDLIAASERLAAVGDGADLPF